MTTADGGRGLRRRFGWLVASAVALWLLVMLVAGDSGALALWRARARLESLQAQTRALEAENRRLAESRLRLAGDDRAVEIIAREELMMGRPDEEVILVPDAKATVAEAAAVAATGTAGARPPRQKR